MTGGASFNEVFFNEVQVPDDHRLGDVNQGWSVALTTLMNERSSIGAGGGGGGMGLANVTRLAQMLRHFGYGESAVHRDQLMDLYTRFQVAKFTNQRALDKIKAGQLPGPEMSIGKMALTDNLLRTAEFVASVLGPAHGRRHRRVGHLRVVAVRLRRARHAHRRRLRRGAAQHRRRARAGPPQGARHRLQHPLQGHPQELANYASPASSDGTGGQMDIANIAGIVRLHGRERPDQIAIVYGEREITWRELDETSNQMANALLASGVQANDRIARIEKNAPDYFQLVFAASKINAVLVDVNWRLAAPEMRQIVDDAGAKVLFVGNEFAAELDKIESELATVQQTILLGRPTPPTRASTSGRRRSPPAIRASRARWTTSACSSTRQGRPGCPRA